MTSLATFTLFPNLPPEIRDKIWALLLPPARIMHVYPLGKPSQMNMLTLTTKYATSPSSYGAKLPIILSVCGKSRAVALRHLTARFRCYWNLEIDTLYIEVRRWGEDDAMRQLLNMRRRGLLKGFKHLAFDSDIWRSSKLEHCMTSLRLLPDVSTCAFIFRERKWHKDVVDPGVSWSLAPVDSEEQTEFKNHLVLCTLVQDFEKKVKEYMENESVENKMQWHDRPMSLEIMSKVINGRKMDSLPFSPSYYEPPGQDWFG